MNIMAGLVVLLVPFLIAGAIFSVIFGVTLITYICDGYPKKNVMIAFFISAIVFLISLFFYNALTTPL